MEKWMRALGRRPTGSTFQEPPRTTRRPQSPLPAVRRPLPQTTDHVRQARRVRAVRTHRARSNVLRAGAVASRLRPGRRPVPLRLRRQPIRRASPPAQPRHIRLRVVPAHVNRRMTVRLRKVVVPPVPAIVARSPPSPTRTPDTPPPSPRSGPSPDRRQAAPPSPDTRRSPGKRRQDDAARRRQPRIPETRYPANPPRPSAGRPTQAHRSPATAKPPAGSAPAH